MGQKANLIIGLIIAVVNVLWAAYWFRLFIAYHFTNILWFYMYPDWILVLNILIGFIGIYIGYNLIKSKLPLVVALFIDITILTLGLIISLNQ